MKKILVCLSLIFFQACSTTPFLDENHGVSLKEALKEQSINSKNEQESDDMVGYPFTQRLINFR